MAENVIILGAGDSAAAGGPLMANFLDEARAIDRNVQGLQSRDEFRRVFRGIGELGTVFEKGNLDTDNLESVFAAFEMAKPFQSLGALTVEEIELLPDAMRAVIVETLEQRIKLPVLHDADKSSGPRIIPPVPYGDFVKLFAATTTPYRNKVAAMAVDECERSDAVDLRLKDVVGMIERVGSPQQPHRTHQSIIHRSCWTLGQPAPNVFANA